MSKAPIDCFDEGMRARAHGKRRRDNPYCAGSDEHREWAAGLCASSECDDEGDLTSALKQISHVRLEGQ